FLDENNGFVVGQAGTILKTTNGGSVWQPLTSGTSATLYSIIFADSLNGWIVGSGGVVLKTVDGGANWTDLSTGVYSMLTSVDCWSSTHAWIAGAIYDNNLISQILKTTNGGANWLSISTGIADTLYALDFVSEEDGWSVGDLGVIIRTHDGGANWFELSSPTNNPLKSVCFVNRHIGWAVGEMGTIIKTTTGGDTFEEINHISELFTKPNNLWVSLSNKIVSAKFADHFYMQEPDRSAGIKVCWTGQLPAEGDVINVTGILSLSGAERQIEASKIQKSGVQISVPNPLGISNKYLGGKSPGQPTPSVVEPNGPYNVGLRVKVWGEVTSLIPDSHFYIDDGAHLIDPYGNVGVKVLAPPPPGLEQGKFAIVVGISGAEICDLQVVRVIHVPASSTIIFY
ncbi:MAG: YCF48-related protein, partial [Armatimonadota bacterium]|nr:YCF48-related protein [Armatimonadota bacterium]